MYLILLFLNFLEPALKTAYRVQAGHPIGQFIGLISEGFVTQADIDGGNLPVSTYGTVKVGDLKYKDMNEAIESAKRWKSGIPAFFSSAGKCGPLI